MPVRVPLSHVWFSPISSDRQSTLFRELRVLVNTVHESMLDIHLLFFLLMVVLPLEMDTFVLQ